MQTVDFSGSIGIDSYQQLLSQLVELEAAKAKINHQCTASHIRSSEFGVMFFLMKE